MKSTLFLALTLIAGFAGAGASLSGTTGVTPNMTSEANSTMTSQAAPAAPTMTTTSMPAAGATTGSIQPTNTVPNGAAFGYPNSAVDSNTTNPGLPQPTTYGGPYYNYGGGTTSGTTTSVNPAGAPFVAPPAAGAPTGGAR